TAGSPAWWLGQGEATEVDRLLEPDAEGLEPLVLLRPDVVLRLPLPRLAGRQRGNRRPEADPDLLDATGARTLALDQLHPGRTRHEGGQIPLALEADPFALGHLRGHVGEVV